MRHLYLGTKKFEDRDIVKDILYVKNEEDGTLWKCNIENISFNEISRITSVNKLKKYFDVWTDLGCIPDGVCISDVVFVQHRIGLKSV